jgi:hypothetical protein
MLRITTTTVCGEEFTIRQLSAFRVLGMERKAQAAAADNVKAAEMIADTLQRAVLVSEDNPVPRYKTEEDMDELSLPQMIRLNEAIMKFSQESDGTAPDEDTPEKN